MAPKKIELHRKLVRDKIPEIIRSGSDVPVCVRVAGDLDYIGALLDKVGEETVELREAGKEDRLGELADLFEVISALSTAMGFSLTQVEEAATLKRADRGGFAGRVWLEKVVRSQPEQDQ